MRKSKKSLTKIDVEKIVLAPHITTLTSRNNFGEWLNSNNLLGIGVEVGSMYGGYAREILKSWKGSKLILVDMWTKQPQEIYRERTDGIDYESCYQQCVKLSEEDKRVMLIRKPSVEAANDFKNDMLDFVYIDANHSYRAVLEDMDAWYPKVKSGGVFSGHDYGDDTNWPNFCEVKSAVDRWMKEHQLNYHIDTDGPSWWSVKP